MTKEQVEKQLNETRQELENLRLEYGKLLARYRVVKAMIFGVMKEVDEPVTQFHHLVDTVGAKRTTKK